MAKYGEKEKHPKKITKRFTVLNERNIRNNNNEVVQQDFIRYFSSDTLDMAQSVAGGLKRINQSYRILDGRKVVEEWLRKGFQESA